MASETPSHPLTATKPLPSPPLSSPAILGPLAILSYILSLPLLAFGFWLLTTRDYDCEELLRAPSLRTAIGVAMIVAFVVSNAVVYYGPRVLMPGHTVLSVGLVVMMIAGLSLVGTYKMEARGVPGSPMWLQNRVQDVVTWSNVKSCLYNHKICRDLAFRTIQLNSSEFSMSKLSPVEAGCCKPPDVCAMQYVNATHWKPTAAAKHGGGAADKNGSRMAVDPATYGDCHAWNNRDESLCYYCESCKRGFLSAITVKWKKVGVFLVVTSVLHAAVHALRFIVMMADKFKH